MNHFRSQTVGAIRGVVMNNEKESQVYMDAVKTISDRLL